MAASLSAILAGALTVVMLIAGAFAAGASRADTTTMKKKLRDIEEAKRAKDEIDLDDDGELANRANRWVRKPGD